MVLVSFGTYTCINWMRSLPYVRAWADKYATRGLLVVGVQTPEFEFEGDLANVNRDLFGMALRQISPKVPDDALDEFWKAYGSDDRRRNQLDLYRSGDFEKLEPYRGKLRALGVPAKIIWGAKDEFAPIGGAYRFKKELPDAELAVLDDAGHFLMEDDPERVAREIAEFVAGRVREEQPA